MFAPGGPWTVVFFLQPSQRPAWRSERLTSKFWRQITDLQWLSVTRALQRFFSISKTAFWWTSIKCIHDNNGERSYWNHYFNVNMSEYPSCSFIFTWLVDKQKLRSKTYKIVGSAFSFVSLTGNVLKLQIYKQCATTTTWDWTKYK